MTPKEINRVSGREFNNLVPPSWIVRNQEDQEDFGIDFEIEPEIESQPTGFLFKVQLKGTTAATYTDDGQYLKYSAASVERFNYYLNDLVVPVIFVIYDLNAKRCLWMQVQGNRQVEQAWASASKKEQATFTILLPTANELKQDEAAQARAIDAVELSAYRLNIGHVRRLDPSKVEAAIADHPDLSQLESEMRQVASAVAHAALEELLDANDYHAAAAKAKAILESPSEPTHARIAAGITLAHAITGVGLTSTPQTPQIKILAQVAYVSDFIIRVARTTDCPRHLKRLALLFARKARMQINARSLMALAISESGMTGRDTLSIPFIVLQRAQLSLQLRNDFSRAHHAITRYVGDGDYHLLPYGFNYIAEAISPALSAMRVLDNAELATAYRDTLDRLYMPALEVAASFPQEKQRPRITQYCCFCYTCMSDWRDKTDFSSRLDHVGKSLVGKFDKQVLSELVDSLREARESAIKAREVDTVEKRKEAYRSLASDMGVDLDGDDDIAKIVRIGIEDLDPTRVLKHCQHIHVATTSYGMPAEMLGLPTAGSKRLTCLVHGHGVEGLKLDDLYEFFAGTHPIPIKGEKSCQGCDDCQPHAEDWQWSDEWQAEQAQRYKERFPDRDKKSP